MAFKVQSQYGQTDFGNHASFIPNPPILNFKARGRAIASPVPSPLPQTRLWESLVCFVMGVTLRVHGHTTLYYGFNALPLYFYMYTYMLIYKNVFLASRFVFITT